MWLEIESIFKITTPKKIDQKLMKSKISESNSFSPLSERQNQHFLHRKVLFALVLNPSSR